MLCAENSDSESGSTALVTGRFTMGKFHVSVNLHNHNKKRKTKGRRSRCFLFNYHLDDALLLMLSTSNVTLQLDKE